MIRPEELFHQLSSKPGLDRKAPHVVVWKVPLNLPYFEGHFPGSPILPGIAILDASTVLLQSVLENPELKIKTVLSAKFLNLIGPGQSVRIEFQSSQPNIWNLNWKDESSEKEFASLKLEI